MKRMKGKLLSTILVLAMTLQCMPAMAFADETDVSVDNVVVETEMERPERPAPEEAPAEAPAEAPKGARPAKGEISEEAASVSEVTATVADEYTPAYDDYENVLDDGLTWTALAEGTGTISESGNYYVPADGLTLTTDITISGSDTVVNLALNGYTLTGTGDGSVITVSGGGTLNLFDSKDATGEITGGVATDTVGGGVLVKTTSTDNTTFNMYGGTITGNTASEGGGVSVRNKSDESGSTGIATFNMYGGIISGNTATGGGVAVYGDNTTSYFNMYGGTISGNNSDAHSAGVFLYRNAQMTMADGAEISGNTATSYAGGVSVITASGFTGDVSLTMNGGTISSNTASSGNGGGVYVYSQKSGATATFDMNGGTIGGTDATDANTATYGGGVYASKSSGTVEVTIDDSTITGNTATGAYTAGGGLYMDSCTVTIEDSTITGNTTTATEAAKYALGGGLYMGSCTATITDSEISGNTATAETETYACGQDIYSYYSNATIIDGTVATPIYVDYATVTRTFSDAFSYSTVDMKEYFDFEQYYESADGYVWEMAYATGDTSATGSFSDSIFTPTTSGGNFVLSATEYWYDDDKTIVDASYGGTGNLVFSMDKKASSSSSSYYIKATATGSGTVAPEDEDVSADSMYKVSKGSDVTFEFDADSGYEVTDVIVNGSSVGVCDEYEFEDIIMTMQTLEVVFEKSSSSSSSSDDDDDDEDVDDEDDGDADESEVPFADVDTDDDNYDGIVYVYENGIMAGISTDVFGGELSITRGMIAAILFRINGSEAVDADELFGDVDAEQYYAEAVKWGKSVGVMAGVSETEFAPNTAITVEQFYAFLYRYASFLGMDMDVDGDTDLTGYGITDYAYNAVLWAVENDIIDEDDLTPTAEALRGDVATGLMNFMDMM